MVKLREMARAKAIVGHADHRPRIWLEIVQLHNPPETRISWRIGHGGRPTLAATAGDAVNDALSHIGMVPAVIMWLREDVRDVDA